MANIHARELRKNMTDAEQALWYRLRMRQLEGYKFRRQHPMGNYIVDFACVEKCLVIELDGGQHAEQVSYDESRDKWIREQGLQVLRFWDNEVFQNMDGVLEVIREALVAAPHPDPPPRGGRER